MHWTFGGIAVILFIIGYLAWFASVLRHRLRAPAFRQMPLAERLAKLGLGIMLLPAVITVAAMPTNVRMLLLITSSVLALVGWTFLPHRVTSKVLPVALIGSGIFTFLVLRAFILSGYSLGRFNSVPSLRRVDAFPQILLLQAYAMIGAGLWLTWRAIDKNAPVAKLVLRERPRITGQPGRPRWGLLLLPIVAMGIELLGRR